MRFVATACSFPRRSGRAALAAVILCTLGRVPATAQQRDWGAYLDSLATRTDTSGLARLLPRQPKTASAHELLAGGFAALRLHQLRGRPRDAVAARGIFDRATSRFPDLAWAHYGRALALAAGPEVHLPSPAGTLNAVVTPQAFAEIVGLDPATRARRELRRALQLDPSFVRAAVELVQEASTAHDRGALVVARDALSRLRSDGRATPEVMLALSDAERALGNVTAAADAATSTEAGTGPGADYARATALLRDSSRMQEGVKAYFAGIDQLDAATAERYFEDVRHIATDREHERWLHGDLAQRKALLRDFWTLRAAVAGREVGERLAEHYRRLAVAEEQYRRESGHGSPPLGAHTLLPNDSLSPFDDRGVIYVRHGVPDHVIRTPSSELRPNETWAYDDAQGHPRAFHFIEFEHAPGYRLVDNVMAVVDPTTAAFDPEPLLQFLDERVPYDPELAPLIGKIRGVAAGARFGRMQARANGTSEDAGARLGASEYLVELNSAAAPVASKVRERTTVALRTDSDAPRFETRLPFFYDLYTFRGRNGLTDLVAALAVPGDRVTPVPGRPDAYVLRLSFILVDTLTAAVLRLDTTYALHTERALQPSDYIRVEAQLSAAPTGTAVERLVLRDAAAGVPAGEAYAAAVPVRAYEDAKLGISDIVLAEPTSSGVWHRGKASLALVPPRQFPEGAFTVFYEIYGLPPGTSYQTSIAVEGMDRDALRALLGLGHGSIRITFRGDAEPDSDGTLQVIRRIRGDLKPGRYRITVEVNDLTGGRTARRSRELLVRKGK
ncbi:MAG TPA: GWxTD domain-containing protein [Longimicrobiales bacterium]